MTPSVGYAVTVGRRYAESMMTSACILRSAGGGEWDEDAGAYQDATGTVVYSGMFNIPAGSSIAQVSAGEAGWALGRFLAKFPLDAPLAVGLLGEVTGCDWNPRLVGMKFKIVGLPPRSHPVHQPAECEAVSR